MGRRRKRDAPYGAIDHVDEYGLRIYIRPRSGTRNFELVTYDVGERARRKTAGTPDVEEARAEAKAWAYDLTHEIPDGFAGQVKDKWIKYGAAAITFDDLVRLFEERELPELMRSNHEYYQQRHSDLQPLKELIPGDTPATEFTKLVITDYIRKRRKGGFKTVGPTGKVSWRGTVGDRKIFDDLNLLGRVFERAREELQRDGESFLTFNPIHKLKEKGMSQGWWPRKGTGGRPKMELDRMEAMLAKVEEQEAANRTGPHMPPGYLRMLLMLPRRFGRRFRAIQALQVRDILRTQEEVRAALRAHTEPRLPESWADHWPHGAILFVDERYRRDRRGRKVKMGDKMRRGMIVPMSQAVREMIDEYLEGHPHADVPTAPLIPHPRDPMQPVEYHQANRWFNSLQRRAGIPSRDQEGYHSLRHLRRSELKGMPDELVGVVLSWRDDQDAKIMNRIYLHYEPDEILACVEMDPQIDGRNAGLKDVMRRLGTIEEPDRADPAPEAAGASKRELLRRLIDALDEDEIEDILTTKRQGTISAA